MSSCLGDGEIRGKMINEDTVRTTSGEEQKIGFKADSRFQGENVVVRGDQVTLQLNS